jgi:plasmid stabilization system protein ParE
MKLKWSERARRDLHAIHAYIAADDPTAARGWVAKLQARASGAASIPLAGRVVPEVEEPDVREVLLRNYRIVHRIKGDEIHILTVFEGHRQLHADGLSGGDDRFG